MKTSYGDLRTSIKENGGLHVVTMGTLRDIEGAGRLGNRVLTTISQALQAQGMGHFPAELPGNQSQPVRVFLLDTPVADVVNAVLSPSLKGDATLRDVGSADHVREQLRQIREIIG
jgi:hypothetical protein